ncbi:hypothetical protein CBS101457_000870 [Exobasidium rhododendri]|nr:hypothetical protein CBS101457_000870 [Exobasidium rhododendri]
MAVRASESRPATSKSNESAASSEEFPLQEPRLSVTALVSAPKVQTESTAAANVKGKSKRFSLRSMAKPFAIFTANSMPKSTHSNNIIKSSRKSLDGKMGSGKNSRRVSFSPSTDVAANSSHDLQCEPVTTDYKDYDKKKKKQDTPQIKRRSSSYNDSIGRGGKRQTRKRAVSFTWDKKGVHLSPAATLEVTHIDDKGRAVRPHLTKKQIVAARHARALEQIINAGSSLEIDSIDSLKAKREKRTGGKLDKTKVQMISAVSPRKVLSLKRALLDSEMANDIIGELRVMQINEEDDPAASIVPPSDGARATELLETLLVDKNGKQSRKKSRPAATKAVCLDCTEEEADQSKREQGRSGQVLVTSTDDEQSRNMMHGEAAVVVAAAATVASSWGWGGLFSSKETTTKTTTITDSQGHQLSKVVITDIKTPASEAVQYARELKDDVTNGDVGETMADITRVGVIALKQAQPLVGTIMESVEKVILPENKEILSTEEIKAKKEPAIRNLQAIMTPVTLIGDPIPSAASFGRNQTEAYDALGSLSGLAVQAANGGVVEDVHPPLDRIAIFIRWWGFEMTIPHSSMAYLGTAQSVSASFLTFLQAMAVTGGVPELLPFVRYFASFMDLEFSAIKSQDRGHGVVVAATWLMPMALVPRPWDYPIKSDNTFENISTPPSSSPHFIRSRAQSTKHHTEDSFTASQQAGATLTKDDPMMSGCK